MLFIFFFSFTQVSLEFNCLLTSEAQSSEIPDDNSPIDRFLLDTQSMKYCLTI